MSEIDPRIREHPHRLPEERYIGPITVSITVLVQDREPLFSDTQVTNRCLQILAAKAEATRCEVPIYCFMPDHLHLMIRGLAEDSTPKNAIDSFKLSAGIWLHTNRPGTKLHKNYYDHIVRTGEDWKGQARYIALNPVRGGLVENAFDYSLTGSIGADREAMLQEIFFGM